MLFRIDVYFDKFLLAVEIDEEGHTDRDLIFQKKRPQALEKKMWLQIYQNEYNVMIQIMRLVTQKHLLMSLKTDNQKKKNQKKKRKKKELEDKIKEKEEESNKKK